MADYYLLIPLVLALAIGWWLGRRERSKDRLDRYQASFGSEYFSGLNHLIDNHTDAAIESFIKALEHDSGTVPVRLALGTLFRRRGEVQRAISLHQEVLAFEDLTPLESCQARLALAQDYFSAGLQDRAESLLLEIIDSGASGEMRDEALRLLVKLYQRESDWERALETSLLLSRDNEDVHQQQAHYCCELAQLHLNQQQVDQSQQWLVRALKYDPGCVRALLIQARARMLQSNWKAAIRSLRKVEQQDPGFVSEAVPLLVECYQNLNQPKALRSTLEQSYQQSPATTSLLAITDLKQAEDGHYQAATYIAEQLKRRPSVKGFNRLIDLQLAYVPDQARDSLLVLRGLTGQLQQSNPVYRCRQCGFSGRELHWLCPSCRHWGSVRPIQGLEGE
ncbi:lipopolysaccharide assembly protein LapB [Motiliproteus coralliicola]|uniref:Lipopolysaccharide assembly protein B n=1 Tax=Motiliproteus coralliicola TaxID=2283196 RepID=A0A369WR23_9GAMM|nr:lipopolysaccharide assembly protein LapB [Motiliproteus coralliicola]RDE23006.1 lipopolysaccharide assembly protein LapB [Motiliproteus coralliicola]